MRMQSLLQWPPIFWALRIVTLVVLVDGLGLFALLTARFFRWKHVKQLVLADLPRVQSVGGAIGATKATVELATGEEEQIAALGARVATLQQTIDALMTRIGKESSNDSGV
jgi:hypothetical protein